MHAAITAGLMGLLDHGLPAVNATRARLGLPPLDHLVDQAKAANATLLCTAKAFDFAPKTPAPNVRYVGPQLDQPSWALSWTSPWPANEDRPLVVVGFSTTFQNHVGVLQRIADALGRLPVRGLITLGDTVYPWEIDAPENVMLVHSAPHDAVMREAAVVVTHGGHGTVVRALAHRRPLLVIPHGRDQNDNAVRVTWRGAGLSLTPDAPTEAILDALQRLLNEPAFAEAARSLGGRVAAEIADSDVVETLEALVGARVPETCQA
jgi:UDP:flavonoid glycosyltransferase YjiC (YdhE family)